MVERDRERYADWFGSGCRRIHTEVVLETRTPGRARMILEEVDAEHEDLIMADMEKSVGRMGGL